MYFHIIVNLYVVVKINTENTLHPLSNVIVYFMCQFDWAKECPVASKTLFLGVPVKGFLEESSI